MKQIVEQFLRLILLSVPRDMLDTFFSSYRIQTCAHLFLLKCLLGIRPSL